MNVANWHAGFLRSTTKKARCFGNPISARTSGSGCWTRWKIQMARPAPAEVWIVDLGLTAKVRPCLILSDYPSPDELALIVIVPHTTALRGNRWEFALPKPFLKPGAFHLQQVQPVSLPRFERRLGAPGEGECALLGVKLAELLHLGNGHRSP